MKKYFFLLAFAAVGSLAAADIFVVSNVKCVQNQGSGNVTVTYDLANVSGGGTALVFLDVLTNGVSIGAEKIVSVDGDVGRVTTGANRSLVWRARADWPDQLATNVTVAVKACGTVAESEYCGSLALARRFFVGAHFAFDDPENPSAATSSMGFDNRTTVQGTGIQIVTDPDRGAVASFDGASYIEGAGANKGLAGLPSGRAPFTIAFWAKPTRSQKDWFFQFGSNGDSWSDRWSYHCLGMRIRTAAEDGVDAFRLTDVAMNIDTPAGGFTPDAWRHFAITYDQQALRIYINGVRVALDVNNQDHVSTPYYDVALSLMNRMFAIGRGTNDLWFKGYMDDFIVFRRALGPAAIAELAAE